MMCPTFDGSGHDCIFGIRTWALGWKYLMFSWRYLLNIFESSGEPLKNKRRLTLRLLARGFPSLSHLLNLTLSIRYLPLFLVIPIVEDGGSLGLVVFGLKGVD